MHSKYCVTTPGFSESQVPVQFLLDKVETKDAGTFLLLVTTTVRTLFYVMLLILGLHKLVGLQAMSITNHPLRTMTD